MSLAGNVMNINVSFRNSLQKSLVTFLAKRAHSEIITKIIGKLGHKLENYIYYLVIISQSNYFSEKCQKY